MTSFIDDLTTCVLSLQLKDHQPFSAPLQWAILTNGGAEQHATIVLFGFEGGKLTPSLVAKTPRLPENGCALQDEYDRLVDLWGYLGPEAPFRVPQPIAMVTLRNQPVMISSFVEGKSLQTSKKAFWDNSQRVLALAVDAAQALRYILDHTATPLAEGEKLPSNFSQRVEIFKQIYSLTENENWVLDDLLRRIEAGRLRGSHKVLIQGDFWYGNLIRKTHQGHLIFIDWQHSHWTTDVSLDVYLFLLAGAMASAPRDSADEKVRGTVQVLLDWRTKLIPAYLAAFGEPAGYTLLPIKDGMLVCCVEKAVRATLDFGYKQADDEIWRLIFAELINWPEESISDHV